MTPNDPIEQMLRKYCPAGPPEGMRARVLAAAGEAGAQAMQPVGPSWGTRLFRWGVAAILLLALGLNYTADRMMRRSAAGVGAGPVVWTEQAEQMAQMLDGNGWGRRYIALGLMAGNFDNKQTGTMTIPGDVQ